MFRLIVFFLLTVISSLVYADPVCRGPFEGEICLLFYLTLASVTAIPAGLFGAIALIIFLNRAKTFVKWIFIIFSPLLSYAVSIVLLNYESEVTFISFKNRLYIISVIIAVIQIAYTCAVLKMFLNYQNQNENS